MFGDSLEPITVHISIYSELKNIVKNDISLPAKYMIELPVYKGECAILYKIINFLIDN